MPRRLLYFCLLLAAICFLNLPVLAAPQPLPSTGHTEWLRMPVLHPPGTNTLQAHP